MNTGIGEHGVGMGRSVSVNADDIGIPMCNDGGHSDCYPSVSCSRTVFRSLSAGTEPGEKSLRGKTVMGHNAETLDKLLSSHQGGPGGVGPPVQSDSSQAKHSHGGGQFCHES
jgi:hypothetical protein